MKRIVFYIAILVTCYAEAQEVRITDDQSSIGELHRRLRARERSFGEFKGTPYLFKEWKNGTIINKVGDEIKTQILYDVYTDEMLIKNQRFSGLALQKNFADSVFIENNDSTLLFVQLNNKEIKPGMYQVLYSGKTSLVVKRAKLLNKARPGGAYKVEKRFNEFVADDRYYVKSPHDVFEKIKLRRGSIKKAFIPYKDVIKDFFRSNPDVDVNTEQGLVETMKFLDMKMK